MEQKKESSLQEQIKKIIKAFKIDNNNINYGKKKNVDEFNNLFGTIASNLFGTILHLSIRKLINYRPISLLTNICKIIKKTMYSRLYKFLDRFDYFYKNNLVF